MLIQHRKKEKEKRKKKLESRLETLQKSEHRQVEHIEEVENELKLLREKRINGIILRAKARWKVEGEKSTKYFCNLEKRHYQEKLIPKLIKENDQEITNLEDILVEQKLYYEKLYTKKTLDDNPHNFFDDLNPFINK